MVQDKLVFVTVGTTKFDKLVTSVLDEELLETLKSLGYNKLKFQTGTGDVERKSHPGLEIDCVSYVEDFGDQLDKADLIISHAGAGTCLEILRKGKPAVVVINEDLMDNHQIELARQLETDGYIYYCTCKDLKMCVTKNIGLLKRYPKTDGGVFAKYLNRCMGFV